MMMISEQTEVSVQEDFLVDIADCNMGALKSRIEKVNKRARKNGLVNFLSYEVVKTTPWVDYSIAKNSKQSTSKDVFLEKTARFNNRHMIVKIFAEYEMHSCKMIGTYPVIEGWEFCGTLQHVDDAVILRIIEGKTCPEHFKSAKNTNCDHCNIKRFRNDTYVIRNVETGEFKQIGSKCLINYFSKSNPAMILWLARNANIEKLFGSDDEGGWGGYRSRRSVSSTEFIAACSYLCQEVGYVSRKAANAYAEKSNGERCITTTGDAALDDIYLKPGEDRYAELKLPIALAHYDDVPNIVEFMKSIEGDGDFLHNLRIIATCTMYETRELGFVAAGVMMYYKNIERLKERVRTAKTSENKYLGKVGDKLDTTAKIVFTKSCNGFYGSSLMVKLMTIDGNNSITTFYSGNNLWDSIIKLKETDAIVNVKGTIKKLDEYNGQNNTIVTRVKIKSMS